MVNIPGRPLNLGHVAYTVPLEKVEQAIYEGRPRINSRTERIDGGVFYPKVMEGRMEAIAVDYKKDAVLREYLEEVTEHIQKISKKFMTSGRALSFEEILSTITSKIAADFPYSNRMLESTYSKTKYTSGKKYSLGNFMANQDMICRHMALLVGAAVDYFKDNFHSGKSIKFKPDLEQRLMADHQSRLDENKEGGHAYLVVRKPKSDGSGNELFILDPTIAKAVNLEKKFKSKNPRDFSYYRYMFSAMRFLIQNPNDKDTALINEIFQDSKTDSASKKMLNDVFKTFKDADSVTRFIRFSTMNAL